MSNQPASNTVVEAAIDAALVIREEATPTEELGTISPIAVAELNKSGLFNVLIPEEFGGLGSTLADAFDAWHILGRADGSSGWSTVTPGISSYLAFAFFGDHAIETIFPASGPAGVVAGVTAPTTTGTIADGGYQASGDYHFGSGIAHADWILGGMFVAENGEKRLLDNGMPEVRIFLAPKDKIEIGENWDVLGLRGTGSYDFHAVDQFFPEAFTCESTIAYTQGGLRGDATYQLGLSTVTAAGHSAVVLGIMARALEEIATLASVKSRPLYAGPIADHAIFAHEFAIQEGSYQSALALTRQAIADAEDSATDDRLISNYHVQRVRQCLLMTHRVAAEVVRWCYTWGGTDALRNPHPLGRCLKDISGATQHHIIDQAFHELVARPIIKSWQRAEI